MRKTAKQSPESARGGSHCCVLRSAKWRIRPTRIGPSDEPPVSVLLDVDREYRAKAAADKLKKIAPKRFNPKGGAWLPILHAEQVALHCGLQYCARA